MRVLAAALATAALLTPLSVGMSLLEASAAQASEAVVGDDSTHGCFEASTSKRTDIEAVQVCDLALMGDVLTPEERGGALVNRGVIRMRRNELSAAEHDFDTAIPLLPNSGEARFNRGAVYIGEKRYKEAVADLDKAIELGVKEPAKVYYFRGIAHDYLNDETSAYQDYKQAEALAPDWDLPKHELRRFSVTQK
jgi:tetratricopeptide (TPR) repeat protein